MWLITHSHVDFLYKGRFRTSCFICTMCMVEDSRFYPITTIGMAYVGQQVRDNDHPYWYSVVVLYHLMVQRGGTSWYSMVHCGIKVQL